MPRRQLQPAAHSLLAGYLLLRISLHEWLLQNILGPAPAAKMACTSPSCGVLSCVHKRLRPCWLRGDSSLSAMATSAIKSVCSSCVTGSSCLAETFRHRSAAVLITARWILNCSPEKGPLSKPPDFLSHLFFIPSHLASLIHFNYASSHFFWSLYSSAAPVLIVLAMMADMFCILKRVWERGQQINIQPRGFWKAGLSQADGHHIIWGKLLAEAVGGV